MKKTPLVLYIWGFLLLLAMGCQSAKTIPSGSKPIGHELWDSLLHLHVKESGKVDYQGFIADSTELNRYMGKLEVHHPNGEHWSEAEQLAYWINAYNAYTIQLVIRHYPVGSIRDIGPTLEIPLINTVWHIEFIEIAGVAYSLDYIEHKILRKAFEEPRIHFAINCASVSCPDLRGEAYVADRLDAQLEEQARLFLNDPSKNKITSEKMELSKILSWFKGDFTKKGPLIDYIRPYVEVPLTPKTKTSYLSYNWQLNDWSDPAK